MYAPGFRWRPWVSVSFAWQAWDNVHCQGVRCTPRGSAGVPGSPPLLRGRRGTMCTAKGSDVRPGVPLASLGLRLFCVAGVGQCALPPRGSNGAKRTLFSPNKAYMLKATLFGHNDAVWSSSFAHAACMCMHVAHDCAMCFQITKRHKFKLCSCSM